MLGRSAIDTHNEPDPDRMDLQDFKFNPGDVVCLYERKRDEAEQWRVQTVLDEMLSLSPLHGDASTKATIRW